MTFSMTAFARCQHEGAWGRMVWEIRSVNHRYLECSCKLPEELRRFEPNVREHIQARLKRGKVDCQLKYAPNPVADGSLTLNEPLLDELLALNSRINDRLGEQNPLRSVDLLRWPGVVETAQSEADALKEPLMSSLGDCIDELVAARLKEGTKLADIIRERAKSAVEKVADLEQDVPAIVNVLLERFKGKIADLGVDVDEGRLEQECAILAQRLDVDEEIERLKTHLDEVQSVLAKSEPAGRRLDFLMQELNREANTLGSKSAHLETTNAAVDLKVLIEQMREQVQNIE